MTEILLAYDGSEPAEHAREVVFARFDPDVVTVLFVFDPGEAGYEAYRVVLRFFVVLHGT